MKVSQSFVVASMSAAAQTQVGRAAPLHSDSQEVEVLASPIRTQATSGKVGAPRLVLEGYGKRGPISKRAVSLNIDSTGRVYHHVGAQSDGLHHKNAIHVGSSSAHGGSLIKAHLDSHHRLQNWDTIDSENSIAALYLEAAGGAFPIQPSYSLDGQTLPNETSRHILSDGETELHIGLNHDQQQQKDPNASKKEEEEEEARAIEKSTLMEEKEELLERASLIEIGILGGVINFEDPLLDLHLFNYREELDASDLPSGPASIVSKQPQEVYFHNDPSARIGLQIRSNSKETPLTTYTPHQDATALLEADLNIQLIGEENIDHITNDNHRVEGENHASSVAEVHSSSVHEVLASSMPKVPTTQSKGKGKIFDSHQQRFKSFAHGTSSSKLTVASHLSLSKFKRWLRNPLPKFHAEK